MKKIKLKMDPPTYNSVDVGVIDYLDDGRERLRLKVNVEFAKYDVEQLQKKGMSIDQAMDYYKDWLYNTVKVNLAQDWECTEGLEEVLAFIREMVARFY